MTRCNKNSDIDFSCKTKSALKKLLLRALNLICYQDQESQPLFDLELRLLEYEGDE